MSFSLSPTYTLFRLIILFSYFLNCPG
jgi:hypothetical protein